MKSCRQDGCDRTDRLKQGYCHRHYEQHRLAGDLQILEKDPIKRFLSRFVEAENGCLEWTGAKSNGYGRVGFGGRKGRQRPTHRVMYELVRGPIPEGLELDHLCRNRACANPDHLEPVTGRVNLLRGEGVSARNAVKTHCPAGHEYTDENTYVWRGNRQCRTCREQVQKTRYTKVSGQSVARICDECGQEYQATRTSGAAVRLCSDECRKARRAHSVREYRQRKRV